MRIHVNRANLILAVISFVFVIYAEWIYPAKAFDQCVWPLGSTAKHIALIADPQIVDNNSYPGRNRLLLWITEMVTDRYMARNYRLLHKKLRPDAIFFLGDLLEGGREWQDKDWYLEFERFKKIFKPASKVPNFWNLPGNHDVGSVDDIIPSSLERFRKNFGEPNQVRTIGEHSIVTLDTNSLMNGNTDSINRPAKEFFEELKAKQSEYDPMILLSHIPFYRPEGSYCGFEREGRPLAWTRGHQYVSELNPTLTHEILHGLKPIFVFSGDDHDACKYTHKLSAPEYTEEYTVKSFSMAMGISRPGFQLLSLDTRKRQETESCLTAKPLVPIFMQLAFFGLLIVSFAIFTSGRRKLFSSYNGLPVSEHKKDKFRAETKNLLPRQFYEGMIHIGLAWILGQIVIGLYSYRNNL